MRPFFHRTRPFTLLPDPSRTTEGHRKGDRRSYLEPSEETLPPGLWSGAQSGCPFNVCVPIAAGSNGTGGREHFSASGGDYTVTRTAQRSAEMDAEEHARYEAKIATAYHRDIAAIQRDTYSIV